MQECKARPNRQCRLGVPADGSWAFGTGLETCLVIWAGGASAQFLRRMGFTRLGQGELGIIFGWNLRVFAALAEVHPIRLA